MTLDKFIFVMTILAALGSGLIAGVFFGFSTFVMKALERLPSAEGMAAMQSINIAVINPMFLGTFFGTAAVCVVLGICSVLQWQRPGAAYLLAGAIFYLIGSLLVTSVFNVPMNDALASAATTGTEGASLWKNYLTNWTFWNHVRTAASLLSTASFIIALIYSSAK